MMKSIYYATVLVALVGMLGMLVLYVVQRALIFPAPPGSEPENLPAHVERLPLMEGHALLMRASAPISSPRPLMIFAHGNAEMAYWSIEPMSHFTRSGVHVLLLEYPGYAGSAGSPSSASIERAILQAYDAAVALPEVDQSRVIAYGRSVGGGPATLLASQRKIAALVLESTFSSLHELVGEKRLPAFLLRDRFDNLQIVRSLSIPIFIYHGTRDQIIPVSHSIALAHAAPDARLVTATCGHNDCPRPWLPLQEFLHNQGITDEHELNSK